MANFITSLYVGDCRYKLRDLTSDNFSHEALLPLSANSHLLELSRRVSRTDSSEVVVALIVGDVCKFDEFDTYETFSTLEKQHISSSADILAVSRALHYLEEKQPKLA